MIMEITALRAQLTDLEEENMSLKKQIREEVQEEYEALVQALFMTCLHRKVSILCQSSGQPCGCTPRNQWQNGLNGNKTFLGPRIFQL